jgi:hypothetical protein
VLDGPIGYGDAEMRFPGARRPQDIMLINPASPSSIRGTRSLVRSLSCVVDSRTRESPAT